MSKFYSLSIKDVRKETDEASVVTFDVPEDLQEAFAFRQGQHLILRRTINGQDERRTYSLCSAPHEKNWRVAVKQIPEGVFSTFVNSELKAGDSLEVMPPTGDFGVPISTEAKNYVAFVAGSGITPVLSMISSHLSQEPESTFKLFYLNKTAKTIMFKEEIEQLKNRFLGRFQVFYFLSRELRDIELLNGRFTEEKIDELTQTVLQVSTIDEAFLCGPEEMVRMIRENLKAKGLAKENIHSELFVSGLTPEDIERMKRLQEQKIDGVNVTIRDGGRDFNFVMTKDYDNILDAALGAGADLPFACKGGVCSTCKCQVESGEVEMKINYALEEDEVAKNYVLSCQAVPLSKDVVVNFDV